MTVAERLRVRKRLNQMVRRRRLRRDGICIVCGVRAAGMVGKRKRSTCVACQASAHARQRKVRLAEPMGQIAWKVNAPERMGFAGVLAAYVGELAPE